MPKCNQTTYKLQMREQGARKGETMSMIQNAQPQSDHLQAMDDRGERGNDEHDADCPAIINTLTDYELENKEPGEEGKQGA